MANPNPWDDDPIVAPAGDSSFTGVIPGAPARPKEPSIPTGFEPDPTAPGRIRPISGGPSDPSGPKDPLEISGKQTNIEQNKASMQNQRFNQNQGLRQEFNNLPEVKNYSVALSSLGTALKAPDTPQGDLATIYAYAKAADPGSVVREGEMDMANATASLPEQYRAAALRLTQGKRLPPEVRIGLVETMRQSVAGLRQVYDQQRDRYTALAQQNGFDPHQIVGDPLYRAYEPLEAQYIRDHGGTPHAQGDVPASAPTNAGGDTPPGVSEMTPDQQAKDKAFLATKPTPEQYTAFLSSLVDGPVDPAMAKKRLEGALAGGGYTGTVEDKPYQDKVNARLAQEDKLRLSDSDAGTLAKQGATLNLSDEAAGIGNAIGRTLTAPFTGHFDPIGEYRLERDVERQRIASARQDLGWGGTGIEIASGLASLNPTNALAGLGARELAMQGAKGGAAASALAGYGQGEGASQSLTGAGVGAIAGGVTGAVAPLVANRLLNGRAPQGMAPELADAAKAENVDLIRPMVDPSAVSDYGALESNVYSQSIIRGGAARVRGKIEGRVSDLGEGGSALEPGAAGDKLQVAGNRYITRTKGIKDRLYRRAEAQAGDTRFLPQKALDQVDQEIADLSGNKGTNAAEINFLETIRDDLAAPGGKNVAEIRNIREGLRGEIGRSNLTLSGAETRALRVLDAATKDIETAVPQAGKAFRRADNFYRERQVMVDDIKRAVLGKRDDPLDAQKAFSNIQSLMGQSGNQRRLGAIMSHLEPGERQDIAATIAEGLGRRSPDEPFSTALFVSQTRKLSPSAVRTLFGPDGEQSIKNLRLLSQKLEDAGKDINHSRSATVLERQGLRRAAGAVVSGLAGIGGQAATGTVSGGIAGMAVGGVAMGASAGRRVLSARAMVNPRVSMWLAQTAEVSTPSQAKQAVKGLSLVISREPALARELAPVRDFLDQRVTQLLAANPDTSDEDQQKR